MKKTAFVAATLIAASQAIPADAATFLFIRHAESTTNAGSASTPAEIIDPPLTALGQQQALALVSTLSGYDINTIFTSAYQRTKLTIAPTASARGLTPITDARTNEWYFGDVSSLADLGGAYGVITAWASGNTAAKLNLPHAESLDDMAARVVPAWQEIIDLYKDEPGYVALVGHGAEIGYVMPYFAKNVSHSFAFSHGLKNTGIVTLKMVNGKPKVSNWQGTVLAVPEPASWAMMIAGFGFAGVAMRRRKVAIAFA